LELYRNSLRITLSVWKALLLREALARLFSSRGAWFWLVGEPVAHMAVLGLIYAGIRQRTIGGIDTLIWLVLGVQGFFLFRRTAGQMAGAIDSNRALFSYRQVLPIDTVLMRGVLEATLMTAVMAVILFGLVMMGHDIRPADPLRVLFAFIGLWLLGVAMGLIVSALSELVPEARQIIDLTMRPLYFVSGVLFSVGSVAPPYRDWFLLNPVLHGIDSLREGFSPYYHGVPGVSMGYLYDCAFIGIFIGLLLHRRFADLMVTR